MAGVQEVEAAETGQYPERLERFIRPEGKKFYLLKARLNPL
ncbi:hypothetical protein [Nocardiopsis ganjiahuensis]|nr:hypothetical protein [Nocardiopsis ganjiahuensis]